MQQKINQRKVYFFKIFISFFGIIGILTTIGIFSPLFGQKTSNQNPLFRFQFKQHDVYTIEKFQFVTMQSNQTQIERQEKNRIVLKADKVNANGVQWRGKFITYERYPKLEKGFRLLNEYNADFFMEWNGKMTVQDKFIMPNIRSIPFFASQPIPPDKNWTNPAEQLLLFENQKYFLPLKIMYLYRGKESLPQDALGHPFLMNKSNVQAHRINYAYETKQSYNQKPIKKIESSSMSSMWFDLENGIGRYSMEKIAYRFTLSNNQSMIYIFHVHSWYKKETPASKKDKTDIVAEINTTLRDNKNKDNPKPDKITVQKTPEGIKLTLNDILFAPDSAVLNTNAKRQLQTIAQFLKKHPNREVRVLGHTDNRGGISYNQKLSEARAQAVLIELKKAGVQPTQLSYKGYGQTKPVADNGTTAGRAKNRRVEIDLLVD